MSKAQAVVDAGGLVSINEAAHFLNVSRPVIYRLMATGELAYVVIGSRRKISRKALTDYVSRHAITRK
jgi:excisionase family DNA binding protein